jgi:hypothetical protein
MRTSRHNNIMTPPNTNLREFCIRLKLTDELEALRNRIAVLEKELADLKLRLIVAEQQVTPRTYMDNPPFREAPTAMLNNSNHYE